MKIAIASSSLPPGLGISTYVDELSKYFKKQGYEIKVFVTDSRDYSLETFEYPVHFTNIPISKNDEFGTLKEFFNTIIDFNPDALLINDCIYASNILPFLDPKCVRISIVHGYREKFGLDGHRMLTKVAIQNFEYLNWIVGTNKSICLGINKNYGINSKIIKCIYNGIEPFTISVNKNNLKKDNSFKTIVFAGGLNPTKGYDVFLKALKILVKEKINNWKVIWIGGKKLPPKKLINSGLLGKFIIWKGTIPLSDLREILSTSHILSMPSRAEACPMLLIDALSFGIVPVVSDCPSAMREIVNEADCGLVSEVGNHKSLAECMIRLLSDPQKITKMSFNAKNYFDNNLNVSHVGEKLLSLINSKENHFKFPKKTFPDGKMYMYTRRKYYYSKWNPLGIIERIRLVFGHLLPIKINNP
jgi:glycosyltransferase involved in cell wall biosynthesis